MPNDIPQRVNAIPAHLALRLIAAVYDLLPLAALWFVAAALALALMGGTLNVHLLAHKLLVQALVFALSAAYFIISWTRGGATIGMRAWRLRVVAIDGSPVGPRRALLRFAVAIVSLGCCGLGFVWCLIDRERRAWHDLAAGTLLVRVEKLP
ncbi:MAG: RDD family protein [Gammaproteobacteria bacterium]|nr:MAG: RDD family protein [Gammaproteobacteria bacterium]